MGNVLTLEDFNTLIGLYGGTTTSYVFKSSDFDGAGHYDFLDVTVSGSNYLVEVVNSLFTGVYQVIAGSSVSYSNNVFTFPVGQTTKIRLYLGENADSGLEFEKYVARPTHIDYVCNMVVKNSQGVVQANKTVKIGEYTGTTDSSGEVAITIPRNRADNYQYPVLVENVMKDLLSLLRTKIIVSPVCTTSSVLKDDSSTLSFNMGFTGHGVSCVLKCNNKTYNAVSDSSTGVVSFTIDLSGFTDDSLAYTLQVVSDDWVNQSTIDGTVSCEYFTVDSYADLKSAYTNGKKSVKIEDTITMNSVMYISRDFSIIGGEENLLTGNGYFYMNSSNKTLKLDSVNTDDLNKLVIAGSNNVVLENCNFESSSMEFVSVSLGGTVTSNNCEYLDMQSPIFYCYGGVLNITNSSFFVTDLSKTSIANPCVAKAYGSSHQYPATTMNISYSTFAIDISENSSDIGLRPSLFDFNIDTTFKNRNYAELLFDDTLPTDTLEGSVNFTGGGTHYTSKIPGKAFIWSYNGRLYKKNVKEE